MQKRQQRKIALRAPMVIHPPRRPLPIDPPVRHKLRRPLPPQRRRAVQPPDGDDEVGAGRDLQAVELGVADGDAPRVGHGGVQPRGFGADGVEEGEGFEDGVELEDLGRV